MWIWMSVCRRVFCSLHWQLGNCRCPLLPEVEEEGEGEGEEEEDVDWEAEISSHDQQLPMLVLPLYSLLSSERQCEVSLLGQGSPLALSCFPGVQTSG